MNYFHNDFNCSSLDMPDFITVVSGYPRSGTSLMMQILYSGGMPVLIDGIKKPDKYNPKGYYEFSSALRLGGEGQTTDWVNGAPGKAVKVIAYQMRHLPDCYTYKVIFMRRNIREVLTSWDTMGLMRPDVTLSEKEQIMAFKGEYVHYEIWLNRQRGMRALYINYNDLMADPSRELDKVHQFLDKPLDMNRMLAAIDPSLYRNRI